MADEPPERAVFRSTSPAATEALGEALGRALFPGALVALRGELGSGKTTLVRGLARGLGIKESVRSPTFTRMQALEGEKTLYHFDAWRAGSAALLAEAGELLAGEGIAVVEWADRVAEWLPRPHLSIELEHRGPSERGIALALVSSGPNAGPAELAREAALRGVLVRARERSRGERPA
jgi:tRNA threonylcarbamoyladenosine biosynthesis protein TsaE